MNGLIRNNFYAALPSAKWIAAALAAFGIAVGIFGSRTWLIIYALLCMAGFSVNAIAGLRKESASKWNKYKLTAPLRRKDILKSYYICQLIWTLAGIVLAAMGVGLSWLIHGFPFDLKTDVATVLTAGVCFSLLSSAIFFPLYYLGGEERNEAVLGISLAGSAGIFAGLVYLLNIIFSFKTTALQIFLSMSAALAVSALAFVLSYFTASFIYRKKEY